LPGMVAGLLRSPFQLFMVDIYDRFKSLLQI
jgi:hypothetical protein